MKTLLPFFLILTLSCNNPVNIEREREKILQTDIDFSNRSVEVGAHQAFIEYAADDVTLLKPNSYPIVGIEALKQSYVGKSDSTYKLTWKPLFGKVAKSGELGYTYGTWQLELLTGELKGKILEGTYATNWEKNEKGEWHFVLDTGNDGLNSESNNQ